MSPYKHPEARRAWSTTEYQRIRSMIRQRRRRLRAWATSLTLNRWTDKMGGVKSTLSG